MEDQGSQDAAIFLMSLGEEEAAEVFKHLSPKEVQKLGETIAGMRAVSHQKVDQVMTRFTEEAASQKLLVNDTNDYVKAVLRRALGDDKASLLIDRIMQGSDVSGIEGLKWMDPQSIAELLRNEHPQIMAAILVHLDSDLVAGVLKHLTERSRNEVMLRIATLEGIQPTALKGASVELRDLILGNMSSRAAEGLREDLESRGPVRLSEVEGQQKEILKIVRRLSDEGSIVMGGGGDDGFV
jgi:flagellar motor switch protein FliG